MDKIASLGITDGKAAMELSQSSANANRLKQLTEQGLKSDKEVEKAAGGFEALMLHNMLKAMWETVDSTGMLGEESNQSQVYRDMFHQAISDVVAEGRGIGVKEFLTKELKQTETASKE